MAEYRYVPGGCIYESEEYESDSYKMVFFLQM